MLRLTAPDGYTASRSYSVASPPDDTGEIELTIERLVDGEVSEFVHDVVDARRRAGGPRTDRRLLRVARATRPRSSSAGGSGVVPLMAMLRQARRDGPDRSRSACSCPPGLPPSCYYADELPGEGVSVVWTREAPPGDPRGPGRMTVDDVAPLVRGGEDVYICGSPAFADAATARLREARVPDAVIRVERFGPSG